MSTLRELSLQITNNSPQVCLIYALLTEEDKSSLIENVAQSLGLLEVDILQIDNLTVDSSQIVKDFVSTCPLGVCKLAALDLSKSTVRAQNSLLTLLEEPPADCKFMLFSSDPLIATIDSRSEIFRWVSRPEFSSQSRSLVLSVLRATSLLDEVALENQFKNWDDQCQQLLVRWSLERMLHRPSVFTYEELYDLRFPPNFEINIISALATVSHARARLSSKSILLSYVERSKGVK